jgi:membrane-bound ClpP family serine protease
MRTLLVIDNGFILIAGLILFAIGFFMAWKTKTSWLYAVSGILWFIPMFLIDNIFIIVFSIAMLIFCGIMAFWDKE